MGNVPWVRMDAGFDFHPDVRRAGHNGSSVFQTLVRLSKLLGLDGHLKDKTLDPDYLSDVMRWDTESVEKGIGACIRVGLLIADGQGGATIPGWDKYQNPDALRKQLSRSERPDDSGRGRTSPDCPATGRDGTGQDVTGRDDTDHECSPVASHLSLVVDTPQPATSRAPRPWSRGTMTREQALAVFRYWERIFEKEGNGNLFEGKREDAIRARANEGATVAEAIKAVLGCYSMGMRDTYPDGRKRIKHENSIKFTLIFRDDEHMRGFIDTASVALEKRKISVSEDGTCFIDANGNVVDRW